MNLSSVADIIHRGGTMLRSARSDEFKTEKGFKKALNVPDVFSIDGLIVLGGDGTLKGARSFPMQGYQLLVYPVP